jgi:hypothetical protein
MCGVLNTAEYVSVRPSHKAAWPCHVFRNKKLAVMLCDVQLVTKKKEETLLGGG